MAKPTSNDIVLALQRKYQRLIQQRGNDPGPHRLDGEIARTAQSFHRANELDRAYRAGVAACPSPTGTAAPQIKQPGKE